MGEFNDGEKHGQGTTTYSNGNKYVGEFNDGKRHGQGTYTWSNGRKYIGEFKNGKKHGQGTNTYSNGIKYVGEFKYDTTWKGTFYDINGNIQVKLVNGTMIKQFDTFPNLSIFFPSSIKDILHIFLKVFLF